MPTTRSKSVGADDAATFEEAETSATSGSGEIRELRSQLAALTDLVTQQADAARWQKARMQRLEDLLLQQAAAREAQVPTPPAPVEVVAPRGSYPALDTSRTAPAIFWRVVDSVPTYGSYPENCGIYSSAKVAEVEDLGCSRVASAGLCIGTTLNLYRNKWLYRYSIESVPVHLAVFCEPEPRVCVYRVLYRYTFPCTGTQCSPQTTCSGGCFCNCCLSIKHPTPSSLSLRPEEEKSSL
uniref:Uncharacterized protein n=1 Tax=Ananas comosus var. bracteatus TaxID=296719 RepID=A0A6V7Q9G7_ANACO|nr:unnamed protein product [Ananas comosus var. bracteatus]